MRVSTDDLKEEKESLCKCLVKILHDFDMGRGENVRKLSRVESSEVWQRGHCEVTVGWPYRTNGGESYRFRTEWKLLGQEGTGPLKRSMSY